MVHGKRYSSMVHIPTVLPYVRTRRMYGMVEFSSPYAGYRFFFFFFYPFPFPFPFPRYYSVGEVTWDCRVVRIEDLHPPLADLICMDGVSRVFWVFWVFWVFLGDGGGGNTTWCVARI